MIQRPALWVLCAGSLWCASAAAVEVDLLVERAMAAQERGELAEAREHALQALRADAERVDAHRVYLWATAEQGLGYLVDAEYAQLQRSTDAALPSWTWDRVERGALPGSRARDASFLDGAPELGPWVLAELAWDEGDDVVAFEALRGQTRPEALALALEMRVQTGDVQGAVELADLLQAVHGDRPDLLRGLWASGPGNGALRREQRSVLRSMHRAIPSASPVWLYRSRRALIAAGAESDLEAAVARLVVLGEPELLSRGPWSDRMRLAVAKVLIQRDDGHLPNGSRAEVLEIGARLGLALHEAGRDREAVVVWAKLVKLEPDPQLAEMLARAHLLLGELPFAEATATRAALLACTGSPSNRANLDFGDQAQTLSRILALRARIRLQMGLNQLSLVDGATAHALLGSPKGEQARAQAAQQGDDPDEALVSATLAFLLHPSAERALRRAQLLEDAGHADAAYVAYGFAAALGEPDLERLDRSWIGLTPGRNGLAAVVDYWHVHAPPPLAKLIADADPIEPDALPEAPILLPRQSGSGTIEVGMAAPAMQLSVAGQERALADYEGSVVILNFWASWCGPCMKELPQLATLQRRLKDEGVAVQVLAVSLDEKRSGYLRITRKSSMSGLAFAWAPDVGRRHRIGALPTTWVIGPKGVVHKVMRGYSADTVSRLGTIASELLQK